MIELEFESKRGFIYGDESMKKLLKIPDLKYKILKSERIQNITVSTFEILKFESLQCTRDLLEISEIKCKHGVSINQKSTHRLPQEGWQELIDCWSCHDHEFNSMLDLKIKPRLGGILLSNFYMIADPQLIPKCCFTENKIFYNEITSSLSHNFYIYKFFEEYFAMKSIIVLSLEDKKYEIKLFYWCNLIKKDNSPAFKVGFRESDRQNDEDTFIGEFFKKLILNQLKENAIGITLLKYNLSFITLQ